MHHWLNKPFKFDVSYVTGCSKAKLRAKNLYVLQSLTKEQNRCLPTNNCCEFYRASRETKPKRPALLLLSSEEINTNFCSDPEQFMARGVCFFVFFLTFKIKWIHHQSHFSTSPELTPRSRTTSVAVINNKHLACRLDYITYTESRCV